jgi:hypothetical protein
MKGKTKSILILILLLLLLYNWCEAASIDNWRERAKQKLPQTTNTTDINPYTGIPREKKHRVYIYKEKKCPECPPAVPQNVQVVEETPIKIWYDECVYCPSPKED